MVKIYILALFSFFIIQQSSIICRRKFLRMFWLTCSFFHMEFYVWKYLKSWLVILQCITVDSERGNQKTTFSPATVLSIGSTDTTFWQLSLDLSSDHHLTPGTVVNMSPLHPCYLGLRLLRGRRSSNTGWIGT